MRRARGKKVSFALYRDEEIEIECTAHVTVCKPWQGPASTCPSSDDYYGYTEVEDIRAHCGGVPVELTDREEEDAHDKAIEALEGEE